MWISHLEDRGGMMKSSRPVSTMQQIQEEAGLQDELKPDLFFKAKKTKPRKMGQVLKTWMQKQVEVCEFMDNMIYTASSKQTRLI